jgi:hypothetical protein
VDVYSGGDLRKMKTAPLRQIGQISSHRSCRLVKADTLHVALRAALSFDIPLL